jgi:hypothetical protein
MDPVLKTFLDLLRSMKGTTIVGKRLFLSTLQLYVSADEDENRETALEIWCENPWQLLDSEGILADSATIQGESEAADAAQKIASQAANVLLSRKIEDIRLEKETQGLIVLVTGGLEVRTFPRESTDDEQWMLRGLNGTPEVAGCEDGIYLVSRDSEGHRTWED